MMMKDRSFAIFAVCSLLLSQNIPSRPTEGNEVVWGKVSPQEAS